MSREPRLTRRLFLGRIGSGAAVGLGIPALLSALAACRREPELATALSGFFADPASARRVGKAYLAAFPDENDGDVLVERLAGADLERWSGLAAGAELAAAVRARHLDDFANERVVHLRGWVLSATEARLCALAALD